MITIVPDNYSQFIKRDREQYAAEQARPRCACCDEPIAEEYYYNLGGEPWCETCIDNTKVWIDE